MRKFIILYHLNNSERLLFMEAIIYLAWARVLKLFPFKKVSPMLGTYMDESSFQEDFSVYGTIRKISNAIQIMSRYTPWESKCLVRAVAGMKMLQRRGINSTLYLGTAKDETGKLIAHAWLRSGSYYVSGAEEMNRFTVVSKFSNKNNIEYEEFTNGDY
ncbi:lasso peptide biosynthesis B2 protein [Mesobacillus subterraneus]|uniref:lasso peptide biosynthesis B2 protein n=1 Tax=Mesobacillus subterraneus TaxID=285983 RepID=UPI001CFCDD3B|nr:lasso peptide biosynthesis B2 protein [Mesobacillus subterraneus]